MEPPSYWVDSECNKIAMADVVRTVDVVRDDRPYIFVVGGSSFDLTMFDRSFVVWNLPSLFPARAGPLCFEDPAFSISVLGRPSGGTMNFTWLIEYAARAGWA